MRKNVHNDMVLIPAGQFEMGDSHQEGSHDEVPLHTVGLDAFYIDIHLVSIRQYRDFVQQANHRPIPEWISKFSPADTHPIIGVDWHEPQPMPNGRGNDCQPRRSGNGLLVVV